MRRVLMWAVGVPTIVLSMVLVTFSSDTPQAVASSTGSRSAPSR